MVWQHFSGTLFLLENVIYILTYVGTEQIRHPWPLLGFWKGLGLWPQFFDLNQQIYLVLTCFEKHLSHSSSPTLKITNPNYLQISLHHPVKVVRKVLVLILQHCAWFYATKEPIVSFLLCFDNKSKRAVGLLYELLV